MMKSSYAYIDSNKVINNAFDTVSYVNFIFRKIEIYGFI